MENDEDIIRARLAEKTSVTGNKHIEIKRRSGNRFILILLPFVLLINRIGIA